MIRQNNGLLAVPEQRALDWLVERVPSRVTPDMLTAVGLLGSVVCLVAYLLAIEQRGWLWVVNFGLAVNWLGDSLDGRLARRRGAERPRLGFFLDQSVDVAAQFLFALGLGLSGYMRFDVAMLGFAAFLMMTVHGLLRAQATRVFALARGGFGLTEVRCIFFLVNAAFFFWPPRRFEFASLTVSYADIAGAAWIAGNVAMFVLCTFREARHLSDDEL